MRLDRSQSDALFRHLKEFPRVATVASKVAMLENFRETSARNVLFFTTILTAFAAVIAIGVVYNNARIALQERAWELASLRVLGFTRGEVSTFLLGELAIEVVACPSARMRAGLLALVGDRRDEPQRHDRDSRDRRPADLRVRRARDRAGRRGQRDDRAPRRSTGSTWSRC